MQVTVNVECSPAEARAFLGLPDLTPLHAAWLERMQAFVSEGVTPAEYERLAKTWMPGMSEGFEQWRQLFLNAGGLTPPRG